MALEIVAFDAADYLKTEADQIALINDAIASGHPGYIARALGAVARAQGGLSALERKIGIKRQTLHKALKEDANPTLETLLPVIEALGFKITVAPAERAKSGRRELADVH